MTLDELVAQLRGVFGRELRSVVLYGSAAAGEHVAKRSDYNVLVIVESLDLAHLRSLSATAREWREAGNPPPLTFTLEEWRECASVFPMEYADILERHRILHGEPPFDGIHVVKADLRLQLEHEAMGKLLALRQGVLAAGADGARQLELLASSLSTIMIIFRAVERLCGRVPSKDNVALSSAVGAAAGVSPEPFTRVVRHLRGEAKLAPAEAGPVLDAYLRGMEGVVRFLDQFAAKE